MAANLSEHLESTSDELLEGLSELADLEEQKRRAQPGSKGFVRLANEVRAAATRLFTLTERQKDLAVDAAEVPAGVASELRPIEASRPPAIVLAEWREAERKLGTALPGSPEALAARAEAARLREEYQAAFRARLERDAPSGGEH